MLSFRFIQSGFYAASMVWLKFRVQKVRCSISRRIQFPGGIFFFNNRSGSGSFNHERLLESSPRKKRKEDQDRTTSYDPSYPVENLMGWEAVRRLTAEAMYCIHDTQEVLSTLLTYFQVFSALVLTYFHRMYHDNLPWKKTICHLLVSNIPVNAETCLIRLASMQRSCLQNCYKQARILFLCWSASLSGSCCSWLIDWTFCYAGLFAEV